MSEDKPLILIVEDDEAMARFSARLLNRQGCDSCVAYTAAEAREFISDKEPDLVVLDIELPDGDGISLCRELQISSDAPVLFLTGRTETSDKVAGLSAGGDYYLTKPYDKNEFLAVILSLLRRAKQTKGKQMEASIINKGSLTLNLDDKKAFINGRDAELTMKEFSVLLILVQHENKELSSEAIYKSAWGADMNIDTGLVRKHISTIKKKLGEEESVDFNIFTEYGRGYIFTTD